MANHHAVRVNGFAGDSTVPMVSGQTPVKTASRIVLGLARNLARIVTCDANFSRSI